MKVFVLINEEERTCEVYKERKKAEKEWDRLSLHHRGYHIEERNIIE